MPTSHTFGVNKSRGFTLIELLITISIISILTLIGLVSYAAILNNSRDAKRQADLKLIQSALEQYHNDQFFYPFSPITFGSFLTNCIGNPSPSCLVTKTYLNNIPKDPTGNPEYSYVAKPNACDNSATNKCNSYCLYAQVEGGSVPTDISSCNDFTGRLEVAPP